MSNEIIEYVESGALSVSEPVDSKLIEFEDEYDVVKNNLQNISQSSQKAIDIALQLAEASEHADMLEVLAKMVTTASKVNRDLAHVIDRKVELYTKSKADISKPVTNEEKGNVTTNNVIVTEKTTAELIREMRESK